MKLESSKLNVAWNALCKVNSKELIHVHSYKGTRIPGRELGFTFRFSLWVVWLYFKYCKEFFCKLHVNYDTSLVIFAVPCTVGLKNAVIIISIFFFAIFWLSQNQRKYFRNIWVWICHWDPRSLSLATTEFMPVEFCLTLDRANSLHILDVLFFRNN